MGEVTAQVVRGFQGLYVGSREEGLLTGRTPLDVPRDLKNFLVDENSHLWMPPAATLLHSFAGTELKRMVSFTGINPSLLIQVDDKIHIYDTNQDPIVLTSNLITLNNSDPVWVNAFDTACYVGNSTETWKITYAAGVYSASEITGSVENGFHSLTYRGRRFVVKRTEEIWFSDLNDPETFQVDSFFLIGGDNEGDAWKNNPGSVVAVIPYQEVLIIFLTQSIHVFTGTDPTTNFVRRETSSHVGVWSRDTIVRTSSGFLFFGGTPRGEYGIYLFTGDTSQDISGPLEGLFRGWALSTASGIEGFDVATDWNAEKWRDLYLFAASDIDNDHPLFVYDVRTNKWTTFDGWSAPKVSMTRFLNENDRLLVSDDTDVYEGTSPMVRYPGQNAYCKLGYSDKGSPFKLRRFLGLKLTGRKSGTGSPTVTVTATTDEGDTATTGAVALDTDVFNGKFLPINLRGSGIQLEITVTPADDDNEVLIEGLELITSEKGEKLSRVS